MPAVRPRPEAAAPGWEPRSPPPVDPSTLEQGAEVLAPEGVETMVRGAEVRTLAAGASISVVARVAGRVLFLLSQMALARLLGAAAFGLYAIGWTIFRIGGLIVPLGLNHAVIRFAPRWRGRDEGAFRRLLLHATGAAVAAGAFVGVVLFASAGWLSAGPFGKPGLTPVLRILAPAFAVAAGLRVASASTQISKDMRYSAAAEELTQPALNLALILGLSGALGWGLSGAVCAVGLSYGAGFVVAVLFIWRLFPEVRRRIPAAKLPTAEIARFAGQASLASVFTMLVIWVDRLAMGLFRPPAEVGIYHAAALSAALFGIVLSGFNSIVSPMAADLFHAGDRKRLQELYRVSTRWGVYVSLPLFLVVCFAGHDLLVGLFGAGYGEGASVLLILSAAQLLNAGTGAVGILLMMGGRQARWLAISAGAFAVNVLLCVLLIPRYGMMGAAVSGGVGIGGLFLLGLWQVRRAFGLWPYDWRYLKGAVATAAAALVLLVDPVPDSWHALARLTLILAQTGVTFFGILILLGVEAEDRQLLAALAARVGWRPGKAAA